MRQNEIKSVQSSSESVFFKQLSLIYDPQLKEAGLHQRSYLTENVFKYMRAGCQFSTGLLV